MRIEGVHIPEINLKYSTELGYSHTSMCAKYIMVLLYIIRAIRIYSYGVIQRCNRNTCMLLY